MFESLRGIILEKYEYWNQKITDADLLDFPMYDLKRVIEEHMEFKLFRYTPSSYYDIRNFENQTIHLSPSGVMNDIYEGIPSTDEEVDYGKIQMLEDLAVMTCFTETNNNALMWSHYADQHRGFCIEYDIKKLNDQMGVLNHLFPVLYREKRHIERDIDSLVVSHIDLKKAIREGYEYDGEESLKDILPLFLIKGKAWEYEKEWRIIYTQKQLYDIDEEVFYSSNIPFDCISAIYLGYRIEPEKKRNILEIVDRFKERGTTVNVYQSKLSTASYELTFEKLN